MKRLILPIFALIFSASTFAQTAGTLTVTATVSSSTYIYSVWITSSTGTYIRTLTHYGYSYSSDLVKWYAASSGSTTNATTGATKGSSATITSTWNGMNISNSSLVADAVYNVWIEMTTESYGKSSKFVTGTFTKGKTDLPATSLTGMTPIGGVTIKWVHVSGTGIQDVEMDKLYSVYPNPAISSIFVSGSDINEVEICSLAGKSILISKEQRIDVSALPKGFYLAVIRSKVGTVLKKFEKI